MANHWKLTLIVLSIAIVLAAVLVVAAARRQSQRQGAAMALIGDLDRVDQRLSQASREFGLALQQRLNSAGSSDSGGRDRGAATGSDVDEHDDLGAVRQSHRALIQAVSQSIAVVSGLEAPASEHGPEFIAAQRKFLLVQRNIIRRDFGRLLELLEDATLPSPQRLASIEKIIDAAYAETEQEFAIVSAARDKFAREFAIQLSTQP